MGSDDEIRSAINFLLTEFEEFKIAIGELEKHSDKYDQNVLTTARQTLDVLNRHLNEVRNDNDKLRLVNGAKAWMETVDQMLQENSITGTGPKELARHIQKRRSSAMLDAADKSKESGVWMIGKNHIKDIKELKKDLINVNIKEITLTTAKEFEAEFGAWQEAAERAAEMEAEFPDFSDLGGDSGDLSGAELDEDLDW
jgi:hypothetical protein